MKQTKPEGRRKGEAGFSLAELIVAMCVTLIIMAAATSLLSQSFHIQGRENRRTAALADTQRALNTVTREVSNAGYNLKSNGILADESGEESITVLSDYDRDDAWDKDEVVSFQLRDNPDTGAKSLVRFGLAAEGATETTGTVLAEYVDTFKVRYFPEKVDYETGGCELGDDVLAQATTADKAQYVIFIVCATLPEVGAKGAAGYQPESRVQLVSDATLRNSLNLSNTALPKY